VTALPALDPPSDLPTLPPDASSTAEADGETAVDIARASDPVRFWQIFGSTFITIFLAELGDKTQVTTLLMSAESHAPWMVFLGAATALISTSLLGVLVGQWLARRVSPQALDTAAAILLLLIMVGLVADVVGSP
jgi:putative Ca2+/H+ antiporter (TMEM165/GDT1 family)